MVGHLELSKSKVFGCYVVSFPCSPTSTDQIYTTKMCVAFAKPTIKTYAEFGPLPIQLQ